MVLRNLIRRKVRTGLTVLGIAVCIAVVVQMISLVQGFRQQIDDVASAGRADLVVSQQGAADPLISYLAPGVVEAVARIDGVAAVHPLLASAKQIPRTPFFFFYGTTAGSPFLQQLNFIEGRSVFDGPGRSGGICLGDRAADMMGLDVGAALELGSETVTVVGIFEAQIPFLGYGGLVSLETAQRLAGHERPNFAFVQLNQRDDQTASRVEQAIEATVEGVSAVRASRFTTAFDEFELFDDLVVVTSVLILLFAGIGTMNTMLMSVFERTREIGILSALGWRRRMILSLVLTEGLLLSLAGCAAGIGLGIGTLELVRSLSGMAWIMGAYTPGVFVAAVAVGIGTGLVGTVYPAWRAVRISPVEALRYE
jgi:putative ABC transport system permease protein